ncbi:MAG: hypothetical protein HYS05_06765 [Acidobacteria bacterium]|nr:hypothetical protein [Acidobacteriota bacterium]
MGLRHPSSDLRQALALALLGSLVPIALWGQNASDGQPRMLSYVERVEVDKLSQLVDAVAAGQLPGGDAWLKWQNHFLRAPDGKTYVPFAISIEEAPEGFESVAVYVRVSPRTPQSGSGPKTASDFESAAGAVSAPERLFSRGAPTAGEASARLAALELSLRPLRSHPFEDAHFVSFGRLPASQAHVVRRALAVPAGEYDVYVSVRERESSVTRGRAPKWAVIKRSLEVPDFSRSELSVSSVIVADRLEPLRAPLQAKEQIERPYALGGMEIVPAADTTFTRDEQLTIVFFVHNPALDAAGKADVTIDYKFFHLSIPEKFFRQTAPQVVNTASATPDPKTRQIPVDAIMPLAPFPPGPYRLEITVHDRLAGSEVTRQLVFTVQ